MSIPIIESSECFLKSVEPLPTSTSESLRFAMWKKRFLDLSPIPPMVLNTCEELLPGAERKWTDWKNLNRLRLGIGHCKVLLHKWGYLKDNQDLNSGSELHTKQYFLICWSTYTQLKIAADNDTAQKCVQH